MSIRLNTAGYHTVISSDGSDTLQTILGVNPDLILLDINMPAGSGPEIQEALKSYEDLSDIPVIYITGESQTQIQELSQDLKPFGILRKPFEIDELITKIQDALEAFPPKSV